MNSPDLLDAVTRGSPKLTASGYSHLTGTMVSQCRTLQNPLFQRNDLPRVDLLMRPAMQPFPCTTYEGYQKLVPISRQSEPDNRPIHTNAFRVQPQNVSKSRTLSLERLGSTDDSGKSTLLSTSPKEGECKLLRTITPPVSSSVVVGQCDNKTEEKSSEKFVGKKKNEVSFVWSWQNFEVYI